MAAVRAHLAILAAVAVACQSAPGPAPTPVAGGGYPVARPEVALNVRVLARVDRPAGVEVCAAPPGGEPRCATAGADGVVALRVLRGTYILRATPPAGARLAPAIVSVIAADPVNAVTMTLEGKATIKGTIRDDKGDPVARAQVCAHPTADEPDVCGRTGADGGYTLEVRPLPYKLEVTGPPDGSRLLPQWLRGRVGSHEADVFDARGGEVVGADGVLIRGLVLSGVIRAASDGRPVKDAQVCTYWVSDPRGWDCERTDKNGHYAALREPGAYWLWFIPPDDAGSRLIAQRYDGVDLGVDATQLRLDRDRTVDVALREGAFIRGRVVTEDGSLVSSALVCVDTPFPTGRICRPTDASGRYAVATRPDTYTVSIETPVESGAVGEYWSRKRAWTDADTVTVGRSDVTLDLVLRRGVRLEGTVLTSGGIPVENASVNVMDARGFLVGAYTDHAGRYGVVIPRGTYTIDVFAPFASQLVSRTELPLTANADVGLDVVLEFAAP